ncbi:hypothetical protein DNL40_11960 [Xylanimonas oleitrophica]|uniref:Integrase catalytic domain-containing protein n=1 Tax=Xylanimonas oleitrophica TaxID=2607479 RepID=A0A2W5WX72_9MICO|nr:DDE-type integrase/transposase/recombinase [Xylanimonas oleitrophica]PZR52385.1 hypothetical protein DNL40_11960 [Xylanimonas oleitrophica]
MTYCRRFSGWVYAAFVTDVFSRRVVGWQLSRSLRTDLALDALKMAIWTRTRDGQDVTGLTHHSDKGVQYVTIRYTQRLAEAGVVASVGSTGDSYDNAGAEALNSLFKAELVRNKGPWRNIDDVGQEIAQRQATTPSHASESRGHQRGEQRGHHADVAGHGAEDLGPGGDCVDDAGERAWFGGGQVGGAVVVGDLDPIRVAAERPLRARWAHIWVSSSEA